MRGGSLAGGPLLERAVTDAATTVRTALGGNGVSVRVALPDSAGRLRVVASVGPPGTVGRRRSSRRREAFETGRPLIVAATSNGGPSLSIVPLRADEETLGLLEIVAPTDRLAECRDAVLALARQSAVLMQMSRERADTQRSMLAMEGLLSLAGSLSESPGPVAAMTAVAEVCSRHAGVPVAVVKPDRDGRGWFVAAAAGFGTRKRAVLRQVLHSVSPSRRHLKHLRSLRDAFASSVDPRVQAFAAGEAVILAGGGGAHGDYMRAAASLLERTLERLTGANGRRSDIGLGIAWTAHELRGPLAGATTALDHVLSSNGSSHGSGQVELLRRTKAELERLTDIVDPLLHWSIQGGKLRRRSADLVEIVRQAVTSAVLDFQDREIRLSGPERLAIRADVIQLRSAIANVIRNALMYSPEDSPIEVAIHDRGTLARVCVDDRGPGIPPGERATAFDPFVRGEAGRGARTGNGLGLFIARRVAEAHGGSLRLERPKRKGASFCFDLPRGGGEPRASAS